MDEMKKIALRLTEERGYRGDTFATADEIRNQEHDDAWRVGRSKALIDEALEQLRWDAEPPQTLEQAQHRVNLAVYSLQTLARLVESEAVARGWRS